MNILIFFLKYSLLLMIFIYIIYIFFFYIIGFLSSILLIIKNTKSFLAKFLKGLIDELSFLFKFLKLFFYQYDSIHQLQNILYTDFYSDLKILILLKLLHIQIKTFLINFYIFFKISTKKNYYFNQLFIRRKKQSSWFWKIKF